MELSCVDPLLVTAVAAVGLDEFARLKSLVFLTGSTGAAEDLRFDVVSVDPFANESLSSRTHSGDSIESVRLQPATQYQHYIILMSTAIGKTKANDPLKVHRYYKSSRNH